MIPKLTEKRLPLQPPRRSHPSPYAITGPLSCRVGLALLLLLWSLTGPGQSAPLGAEFTYQGQLNDGAVAANGNFDFSFSLCTAASGNNLMATLINLNVRVTNGLFTTPVDFGANMFTGYALWMEIGVRSNGTVTGFALLQPRQPITATPYA